MKVDSDGTDGNGNPTHIQFDAKFDGKDYPATGLPESALEACAHSCRTPVQERISTYPVLNESGQHGQQA
jgi:hypothetical protein